jgi:guanosine-3',5'-bis(diphosphate) 3'-pyrophosphohydrolase
MAEPIEERARSFCVQAHVGQRRKYTNTPYHDHCYAVAALVDQETPDMEIVAAAYLHDTLEDTPTTFETLRHHFGDRVAGIVQELTDEYTKQKYPGMNRAERKRLEANRLSRISDEAKLIKRCDLIDNTSSIVRYDPDFAVTYLREKAAILEALGYGPKKRKHACSGNPAL